MDVHPSSTDSFDDLDWALLSNVGGVFPEMLAQNTLHRTAAASSGLNQSQLQSQSATAPSHTPLSPNGQFLPFATQHSDISQAYDAYALFPRILGPVEEQHPTPAYTLGGVEERPEQWSNCIISENTPTTMPLGMNYSSSTSHNESTMGGSPAFEATDHMQQDSYISDLLEDVFPTRESSLGHFSCFQPTYPQLDLMQIGLTSNATNQIPLSLLPDNRTGVASDRAEGPGVWSMLGWKRRASTYGEHVVPLLSTGLLAPPNRDDANRSPSSASTAGSCSSFGGLRPAPGELSCYSCNITFANQGDLSHHLRSHQPYSSRRYGCNKCDRRFQYRKDLLRHLPRHDPHRKRYYCPLGNCKYHTKGFGRQDHLTRHIGSQHSADVPSTVKTVSSA